MSKRLLLLSNSTNIGEEYLFYPRQEIKKFLGSSVNKIVFIPFAAVTSTYQHYTEKVEKVFQDIGYEVDAIHLVENPHELIKNAEAVVVGGGNTFHLIHCLHQISYLKISEIKLVMELLISDGAPVLMLLVLPSKQVMICQ
jgi:dipeptidase E